MSIFNQNTIEESGDWAVEQLYNVDSYPCPVCKGPHCVMRKSDGRPYYTVYDLFEQYLQVCDKLDRFAGALNFTPRYHSRKDFIHLVKEKCEDKVLYKNNYYYSIDWFKANISHRIADYYFEI